MAAARDLLDLLPLLLLLDHVRVDAAPPALPLAQVLQQERTQRPIIFPLTLWSTLAAVWGKLRCAGEAEEGSERGGRRRATFEGVLFVSSRLLPAHLPCVQADLNAALYCTEPPLFNHVGPRHKVRRSRAGELFFFPFFLLTLIFPAVKQQSMASQSGAQLLWEHFFLFSFPPEITCGSTPKCRCTGPGLYLPPQPQLSRLHHETIQRHL